VTRIFSKQEAVAVYWHLTNPQQQLMFLYRQDGKFHYGMWWNNGNLPEFLDEQKAMAEKWSTTDVEYILRIVRWTQHYGGIVLWGGDNLVDVVPRGTK
jgi:hypothetical protein